MKAGFKPFIAAAGAVILLASGASSASADVAGPGQAGKPARCVKKVGEAGGFPGIWRAVHLENHCGRAINVKVVWNNGGDDPCRIIQKDVRWRSESTTIASYEATVWC